MKTQYPVKTAQEVGARLMEVLGPACERIAVAGSVRRQAPTIGDIELLAIPCIGSSQEDLFGSSVHSFSLFDSLVGTLCTKGYLRPRPNKLGHIAVGSRNKFLVDGASDIPVDLFTTSAENWGMALVVRTGPKAFNIALMARLRARGMRGHVDGRGISRWIRGHSASAPSCSQKEEHWEEVACPDEETVFDLAGLDYLPPQERGRVTAWAHSTST